MRRFALTMALFATALLATLSAAEAGIFCLPRLPFCRPRLPAIRIHLPAPCCRAPACHECAECPAPKANDYYDRGAAIDESFSAPAPDSDAAPAPVSDEPPADLPPGEPADDEGSPSDAPVSPDDPAPDVEAAPAEAPQP